METRVVVDASVWVSWLRPSEAHHAPSSNWMEQYHFAEGILVVPAFLLIEVAASISRLTGDTKKAKETVRQIASINNIQIMAMDNNLIQYSVEIAANLRLRAGDAPYVAVAHQLHIPLISWDKEQLERASSLITTFTPDTYM
jgi:predicted nucleic acid-binding protein